MPHTPEKTPASTCCNRLDTLRSHAKDAIEKWQAAEPAARPHLFMAACSIQDHISVLKHRNPRTGDRASTLDWVDDWRPNSPFGSGALQHGRDNAAA